MSIHVASAVAVERNYAQELLDAVRQCCQVGVSSPDSRNSALVLGNSVRVWGILTLAFRYPEFNFVYGLLEHHTWQLWWFDHLVQSGCHALALEVLGGQAQNA